MKTEGRTLLQTSKKYERVEIEANSKVFFKAAAVRNYRAESLRFPFRDSKCENVRHVKDKGDARANHNHGIHEVPNVAQVRAWMSYDPEVDHLFEVKLTRFREEREKDNTKVRSAVDSKWRHSTMKFKVGI